MTKTSQPTNWKYWSRFVFKILNLSHGAGEIIKWLFTGTKFLIENPSHKQHLKVYLSYLIQKKLKSRGKYSVLTIWRATLKRKIGWVVNLIINIMRMSKKAVSMYF